MALNVNNVDVNFFRVKPESLPAFISQWEYRNSLANWQSDKLLQMADLVYTGRLISILRVTPVKNIAAAGRYQTASAGGRVSGCDESGWTLRLQ